MKFIKLAMLILIAGMLISVGIVKAGTKLGKWEGFRGLKWATNIKDVNDMLFQITRDDIKIYTRTTDKLSIGKAKLHIISYNTYKDSFCAIVVVSKGNANFKYLKEAVFAHYGEGYQDNEYIDEWIWDYSQTDGKVVMRLKHNNFSEEANLTIWYRPIWNEKARDDAKAAEDAEDDF